MGKNNGSGKPQSGIAFWAVLVGGIAYIAAYCLSLLNNSGVRNIMMYIVQACCMIAWLIVMVFGWRHAHGFVMHLLFLICCAALLLFGVFVFFGIGLPAIKL